MCDALSRAACTLHFQCILGPSAIPTSSRRIIQCLLFACGAAQPVGWMQTLTRFGIVCCRPDFAAVPPQGAGCTEAPLQTSGRFTPAARRVTQVVLVGGATHMPQVRDLVARVTGIQPQARELPLLRWDGVPSHSILPLYSITRRYMHLVCRPRWILRMLWRWGQRCLEESWRVLSQAVQSWQMDLTAGTCMPEPAASAHNPAACCMAEC